MKKCNWNFSAHQWFLSPAKQFLRWYGAKVGWWSEAQWSRVSALYFPSVKLSTFGREDTLQLFLTNHPSQLWLICDWTVREPGLALSNVLCLTNCAVLQLLLWRKKRQHWWFTMANSVSFYGCFPFVGYDLEKVPSTATTSISDTMSFPIVKQVQQWHAVLSCGVSLEADIDEARDMPCGKGDE